MIYLLFFAAEIEEMKKRMAALETLLSSLAAESISQMKEVDRLLQLYEESVCVCFVGLQISFLFYFSMHFHSCKPVI